MSQHSPNPTAPATALNKRPEIQCQCCNPNLKSNVWPSHFQVALSSAQDAQRTVEQVAADREVLYRRSVQRYSISRTLQTTEQLAEHC